MESRLSIIGLAMMISIGIAGCATRSETARQSDDRTVVSQSDTPSTAPMQQAQNDNLPAVGTQSLKGEVLQIEGRSFDAYESYVVRDSSGKEVRLPLSKDTKKDDMYMVGDRIEARLGPDGRAIEIKRADDTSKGTSAAPSAQAGQDLPRDQSSASSSSSSSMSGMPPLARGDSLKGEVLKMEGEFFVVRDASGKEVSLRVDKDTKMVDAVQVGDKIEAELQGDRASSIRKSAESKRGGAISDAK